MRAAELATALAVMAVAAIAIADSQRKAGWTSTGPDSGFYPFWSAAVVAAAAAVILVQAWRMPTSSIGVLPSREGVTALAQLVVPLVAAVALLGYLGFYLVAGAYMGLFARFVGRYPWVFVLVLAAAVPTALYLLFEQAFRFPLPKSPLYPLGLLPV